MMTDNERRERNVRLAKGCGWRVIEDRQGGKIDVAIPDQCHIEFDATRSLDDCKRVEDVLGVLVNVKWVRQSSEITGEMSDRCYVTIIKIDIHSEVSRAGGATEAEARSAALDALNNKKE